MTKPKVQQHPATLKRLDGVAGLFLALRKRHKEAADHLWAGMVASQVTDADWALLAKFGYLSPHDERCRSCARRGAQ